MKIVIGTVKVPFVIGGAEYLARNLRSALYEHGHEAEIISMPFIDSPLSRIEEHIVAARLMDQEWSWGGRADLFIGLKFPAYYMPHPNKVIWALHQHRAAYDLFNTEYSNLKNNSEGVAVKEIVKRADDIYIREAKRVYTIADNVTNRMLKYNNIIAQTLYHPCPDMEKLQAGEYQNYILMPSRINITKRQMLALEALLYSESDIALYFVGKAEAEEEKNKMLQFVKEHRLEKRVQFFDFVSQEDKIRLYANARAVMFIPKDEDYGYITLEAMSSAKAVITVKDSGGPLEFVNNGETGIVCEPKAKDIAKAIDFFAEDLNQAIRFGEAGKKRLTSMNISWSHVVKELTRA